jgi:hypothetical protein
MNKYILLITLLITTASFAFFNMPQQMFQTGSQMIFPAQPQPTCNCQCPTRN